MATIDQFKPLGQLFEENQGKTITMGGRKYRVRYQSFMGTYPYPRVVELLSLVPVNKNSRWYQEIKNRLGDDWFVDAKQLSDRDFVEVYRQLARKSPRARKPAATSRRRAPGRRR